MRESPGIREESERPRQGKCFRCHRRDQSWEQCPKLLTCDYCQGRFHTTANCKEWLAFRRQQELLNTVRIATQEPGNSSLTAASLPWDYTPRSRDSTPPIIHNLTGLTSHQCMHRINTLMPSSDHSWRRGVIKWSPHDVE